MSDNTSKTAYSEIRSQLKTGDLVLFSGKRVMSAVIKAVTRSRWSHVGMVFNFPEYDFVTVWESTIHGEVRDVSSGHLKKGVQLVPLSNRVHRYNGRIAIRHLSKPIPKEKIDDLNTLRLELRDRPYEKDRMELAKAAYDGIAGKNEEDLTSVFCSELVAEAYQRAGLLTEDTPSNEYTPADFSAEKGLKLERGFALGEEISIADS